MGTSIHIKINEVLFLACMCLPFKIYEKASLPCHFFFFRGYLFGIDGLLYLKKSSCFTSHFMLLTCGLTFITELFIVLIFRK